MSNLTLNAVREIQSVQTSSLSSIEYTEHEEMRRKIQADVDAFLARGGVIEKLESTDYRRAALCYNTKFDSQIKREVEERNSMIAIERAKRNEKIIKLFTEDRLKQSQIAAQMEMSIQNVAYVLKKFRLI